MRGGARRESRRELAPRAWRWAQAGGDDLKVNQDLLFVEIVSDLRSDKGGDVTVIPESYDFSDG